MTRWLTPRPLSAQPADQDCRALGLAADAVEIDGFARCVIAGAVGTEPGQTIDVGSDERDVAGAAFEWVERRHLGEAEVAIDRVELGQQRLVARGRRHRRIAFAEYDLRVGPRRVR